MARKISAWILIVLGAIFLVLSVVGIVAAWVYNEPLTRETTDQLREIDSQLSDAQSALQSAQMELERTLRIVDAAEKALEKLAQQSTSAESILDNIQNTLDKNLIPELKTTRGRIVAARGALESLRTTLEGLGSLLSIDLNAADKILTDLIDSTDSLDSEIANVEKVAQQASTFVSDTSYLLGSDLTETRDSLENFLAVTKEYQQRVADWRKQVEQLIEKTPSWIDRASVSLTIFLLWFGLSQFGLILHGLHIRRGDDPLAILRKDS